MTGFTDVVGARAGDSGCLMAFGRRKRRPRVRALGIALLGLLLAPASAFAGNTCTWHQTSGNNFGTAANWNNCGGVSPGGSDGAVFDGTSSSNCTIASGLIVGSISINSGYNGTITQASGQYIIVFGTFAQASGTFTGGDYYLGVDGNFTLSGGTFTSTSQALQIYGAFTATGGTFNHHSGQVTLSSPSSVTFASNGVGFYDLTINDGLVGYWPMDESTGTSITDLSGNPHTTTTWYGTNPPTASTTVPAVFFPDSHSKAFTAVTGNNTTTQYLAITNMTSELEPSTVTMSAWYRSTGNLGASGGEILSGSNRYSLRVYNGTTVKVGKQSSSSTWVELSAGVSNALDGNWHHLAGVINGSGMKAYFDGVQVASNTDTAAIFYGTSINNSINGGAVGYINFGRNQDTAGYEFSGNIDEARVYNRALSAAEIAALAAGNLPAGGVATQTLTGSPSVAGDLVVASGTLAAGSNTITVGGTFLNCGGVFTNSGTLAFNGSASGYYITGGSGSSFQNLTVSGTGGWTLGDTAQVTVAGNLNISGGTLTATPGLLLIQGAFNKTAGTFTHNNGQVMLASTSNQTFATNGTTFKDLYINDGLVGYWPLDETTIGTASDASGYGNDATAYNTPTVSSVVPTVDFADARSVSFAKASFQYFTTSSSTLPSVLQPSVVTLSAWYKATSVDGSGSDLISGDNRYILRVNSSTQATLTKQTGASTWISVTSNVTTPLDGNWHHLAGVITGAGMTLYYDGVQVGSNADTTEIYYSNLDNGVNMGRNPTGGTWYMNGNIDDVRIYNRALSAAEVRALAIGRQPGTALGTQTMTGAPTVAGNLVIAGGELAVSTNNVTVTGSWLNYGGMFTPGTQTTTFNGSGATSIRSSGQIFSNITYSGSGTMTLADRLETDPSATLSATAGTFNFSSYTLRAGNVTRSGSATITPSTSTVILDSTSDQTTTAGSFTNLRIEPVDATALVGYWKLDECQGLKAHDYSGNGNTATLTSGPTWIDTSLPSRISFEDPGAMTFDGSVPQYLTVGSLPAALQPTVVTMSAWYKGTSVDTNGSEIVSGGNRYALRVFSSTQMKVVKQTGSGTWIELVANVTNPLDGNWHHMAGVITGTGMTAYFDGVAVGSNSDTSSIYYSGASALMIGRNPGSLLYDFFGSIDDVRVYNTALSASQIAALWNGTYPPGLTGTSTYTLGANTTVSGTFAIDNGTFNTGTGFTMNNSITGTAAVVNSGGYVAGSAASTFSAGLNVTGNGTLTMATSGGAVKVGSTKTLTIDGTLNASSTGATIQTAGSAGTYYSFKVGSTSTATPTLNITGLAVKNTDTNGMYINAVTGSTTTFTRFDNIAFSGGTGTQLLQIYAPSLYLASNGCSFDSGTTATTTYDVTLTGDGSATETRALFGGATCASNKTSCEAYDNDNDANTDGVGDTAASNGAVVQWISAAEADTNGTIEGFPTAAFDWSTFTYYATYVEFHDVDAGTADRIYVRDTSGAAKYSWDGPSGTDLVGAPRFDTVSSVHYVYVATASGKVYRLIDSGTSLTQDNTGNWAGANNPFDCACTITTPLTMDATNVYWGGILTAGSVNKVWTLGRTSRAQAGGTPLTTTALVSGAAPALWTSTDTYLFVGETTHFDKLDVTSQALTTTNASPTGTVNGRISVINNKLFGADTAGKLWVLDPAAAGLTTLWSYHDDTNHNGCTSGVCAVTGSLYVDFFTNRAFYGDSDGHLYASYNSAGTTGAQLTGFPYRPGSSSDVYGTAPLYVSGVLVAGTTTGKVYIIDLNGGSGPVLLQTYKLGASARVSGIGYDKTGANYLISAADATAKDGNIYYIPAVTDPTPGSN